jgi:hypothetical protein
MSYIYSSNSPHFLEYIASCKTREDVINDPALCVLVNDPHIKDNMELAFLAREADYGDRAKKAEFIGFFLANGPELDTDTIMHYRNKILMSSAYSSIAKEYYSDITVVDDLRVNKYGKEVDTTDTKDGKSRNCFTNPCDYLQPINAALGMIGDSENFKTVTNIFARKSKNDADDKDVKDGKVSEENKPKKHETTDGVWGNIRKHVSSRVIPAFQQGYNKMMSALGLQMLSLAEKNRNAGISNEVSSVGDSRAEEIAETVSGAVKTNIFANMGDCARLWEHMRRLNLYDVAQNSKGPADTGAVTSARTPEGLPKNMPGIRNENYEAQGVLVTNAPGANASSKPSSMCEMVHNALRLQAQRYMEQVRNDNTYDAEDASLSLSSLDNSSKMSVWAMWEFCAAEYGWDEKEWKAARAKDRLAIPPRSDEEEDNEVNIYSDKKSRYWKSYTDLQSYKRIAAEYESIFGEKFPYEFQNNNSMLTAEDSTSSAPEVSFENPTISPPNVLDNQDDIMGDMGAADMDFGTLE